MGRSMTELAARMAWQAVQHHAPDEVREAVVKYQGVFKDTPVLFAGRKSELAAAGDMMARTVAAGSDSKGAPPALVIQNAPGAGKTSLVRAVEEQLQGDGYAVVHLAPADIGSSQAMVSRIRSQEPWKSDSWLDQLEGALTDGLVNTDDAVAKGIAKTATKFGIPVDADHLEPMRIALQAMRERQPAPPSDVLRLLPHASAKATLVRIDEAQLMSGHLDTDRQAHAEEIIRSLTTANGRHDAGISHVNAIFAGLGDTHTVLRKLGSLRLHTMPLGPLDPEAQELVLVDAIGRVCGGDEDRTRALFMAWGPPLIEEFGEWAHHLQSAAQAAGAVIAASGNQDPLANWGLPAVRALATRFRRQLYVEITQAVADYDIPERLMVDVARALRDRGNAMGRDEVDDALGRAIRDERERNPESAIPGLAEARRLLHRAGMLETISAPQEDGTERDITRIAIPSLINHIVAPGDGGPREQSQKTEQLEPAPERVPTRKGKVPTPQD